MFASLLKMTTRVENVLGPVHMEVGQPGRWDSPLGGTNFFARSHGKILSWPLGCVLSRNHWRANIRTCKPKAHAQLAIFHPGRWDGLFIWDSGLVRRQSVWPVSWDHGSLVPGSHRAGQLACSYEGKNVLVWIIGD